MKNQTRQSLILTHLAGFVVWSLSIVILCGYFVTSTQAQEIGSSKEEVSFPAENNLLGLKLQKLTLLDRFEMGLSPIINPSGLIKKLEIYIYDNKSLPSTDGWLGVAQQENIQFETSFAEHWGNSTDIESLRWKIALKWQIGLVENFEQHPTWFPVDPVKLSDFNNLHQDNQNQIIGSTKPIPGASELGTYWVNADEWLNQLDQQISVDATLAHEDIELR